MWLGREINSGPMVGTVWPQGSFRGLLCCSGAQASLARVMTPFLAVIGRFRAVAIFRQDYLMGLVDDAAANMSTQIGSSVRYSVTLGECLKSHT